MSVEQLPERSRDLSIRDMPAWLISTVVHLALLFVLASITQVTINSQNQTIVTSALEDVIEQEEYTFDVTVTDQIGSNSDLNVLTPSQAMATSRGETSNTTIEDNITEEIDIDPVITTAMVQPSEASLTEVINVAGETEHTGGVEGAMDRLTFEIAGKLKEGPTFVVWLFDASLSLEKRREAMAERFENVYSQLGVMGKTKDDSLVTAVATFGQKPQFITEKPVTDVGSIIEAIKTIPADESGKEYVFTALDQIARKWIGIRTKQRRNMMIIIVTDEKGDDAEKLDGAIQYFKRYGINCYCVGNASLFGKEKGYVTYTWQEGKETFTRDLPVDQGPESVFPERIDLAFWGNNKRSLDRMSASYGPYALTRLCAETGGLYLITEESRGGPALDRAVMRGYTPDYRPIKVIDAEVRKNPAKMALINAARASRVEQIPTPTLEFLHRNDNELRQQITEAQKPLAVLDYRLEELYQILKTGEKARDSLTEPRWRASYDLAMGRVLAMRARAYGYNFTMAEMKSTPKTFSKEGNNKWDLVPDSEISAGPLVKKMAKQSEELLKKVIDEHEGTPWALLAAHELSQPMGWKWVESKIVIPEMAGGMNNNDDPRLLLADEEERRRMMNRNNAPQPKNVPSL